MPRIADYSIIADEWVVEATQDTINFEVPSNVDPGSRSILGFVLHADNDDDMNLKLRLNGTEIWSWNYPEGKRWQCFLEVIPAGVVKSGANVFSFDSSSGDFRLVKLSDIVVWWQANI